MSAAKEQDTLFPTIGNVAEQTGLLSDGDEGKKDEGDLNEDEDRPVQEVTSLCMVCHEQGVTRMLLTTIPYFGQVIIMSFRCEHCGNTNNEIQSAGTIREHGTSYTVHILSREDLNRQIVKSDSCTVIISEYELTIPPTKGQLTNVEGLIRDVVRDLSAAQPLRRIEAEDQYKKIQHIIDSMEVIIDDEDDNEETKDDGEKKTKPMPAFTIKLDDPAGNSFIEFHESLADPKWNMQTYNRTKQQNIDLGLVSQDEADPEPTPGTLSQKEVLGKLLDGQVDEENPNEEIYVFPGVCSSCGHPLNTMMKKVSIPYFKDILIMSTNCAICGYRDNEVKSGGAISDKGKRITLKVQDADDLTRDILKSETCGLSIPEIDLVLQPGTLGGRFSTLEGILTQVFEELNEKVFAGDSNLKSDLADDRTTFEKFLGSLKEVMTASRPFTIILDDPLANSYLQNIYAPDPDPNMTIESYERSWDDNEQLGLNDIKVEGYEEDAGEIAAEPHPAS